MNNPQLFKNNLVEINPDSVTTLIEVHEGIPNIIKTENNISIPSFVALLLDVAMTDSCTTSIDFEKFKKTQIWEYGLESWNIKENMNQMSNLFLIYSPFSISTYNKKFKESFSGEFIEFVPLSGPREIIGKRFIEYIDFKTEFLNQINTSNHDEILMFEHTLSRMINRSDIRVIS